MGLSRMVMTTYHHIFPDKRNKNIHVYGLWVGISTVFKILKLLWCKGNRIIPHGHDLHNIKCSLTQGTRMLRYMVYGGELILEHPALRGTRPLHMVLTYIPSDAT
jgi:hypothetical protein